MEETWTEISVQSTCKRDDVIARDRYNKCIPNPVSDPNQKYLTKRIRKCTYSNDNAYRHWLQEYDLLINLELRSHGRRVPGITTFIRYRPNWIKPCDHLSQFACHQCVVEFGYVHKTLNKVLKEQHCCRTAKCLNYFMPMGIQCTCAACIDCKINKLQELSPYDLLGHLCCDSDDVVPRLECTRGDCNNGHCNSGQYFALLHRGIGCHVFVAPNGKDIAYELRPVGQSTSEQEVDRLHKYLSHRYARDWQNHCRDVVANKQIDGVHLHPNTSFFSMDL